MKFLISLLFAVSFGQDERIDERGPRFCGTPENKVEENYAFFERHKISSCYDSLGIVLQRH